MYIYYFRLKFLIPMPVLKIPGEIDSTTLSRGYCVVLVADQLSATVDKVLFQTSVKRSSAVISFGPAKTRCRCIVHAHF